MARTRHHRPTLLERIVERRTGEAQVASVGVAVERVAEEIAKQALADETLDPAPGRLGHLASSIGQGAGWRAST
jgi:hypothetical protein